MRFYDIDLENQIQKGYALQKIDETIKFSSLVYRLKDLKTEGGRHVYGVEYGLKCLFLQFYYDVSDQQLE